MADPGFSQEGASTLRGGMPENSFIKFSQKLHEIENKLVAVGGGAGAPPELRHYLVDLGVHFILSVATEVLGLMNSNFIFEYILQQNRLLGPC